MQGNLRRNGLRRQGNHGRRLPAGDVDPRDRAAHRARHVHRHVFVRAEEHDRREGDSVRVGQRDRGRAPHQAERQVLPDRDPLRGLRHRGGLPLPVGLALPRARLDRVRRDARVPGHPRDHAGLRLEEGSARMGKVTLASGLSEGFVTTKLDALLAWARKYSLFQYPFATACCGMEFFAVAGPRYDIARFGAEAPRFSPRQSDVLWVVGTISQRQAPALKRIYEQMADPKWVVAFGTCASCGGFYDNYTTVAGIDKIVPCDIYVPGCPPRPEAVIDGLMLLQDKIQRGDRTPAVVKPRTDPVDVAERLTQIRSSAEDR